MPLFPGLCVYTECLALHLPACERQACLCPGPLCSILPSCPKEAGLLGARTRLFFVCRASHCLSESHFRSQLLIEGAPGLGYEGDSFLAMPREGCRGLELILYSQSSGDAVLAGPSDLTCQDSATVVLFPFLVYPLYVPSHPLVPGDRSQLPDLSLTKSECPPRATPS